MVGCEFGTGTFRSHALSFPGTKVDVSFQGTKLPSNIRSHELGSRSTR